MLHQSLEKEREPGDRARDQTETKPSSHHTTGANWTEPDQTGFTQTEGACSEPEGAELNIRSVCPCGNKLFGTFLPNVTFVGKEQECSVSDGGLVWRFGGVWRG